MDTVINPIVFDLMKCFPGSYINAYGEFVSVNDGHAGDAWFYIRSCTSVEDLKYKVLTSLVRAAYKTEPWSTKKRNDVFHNHIRSCMNRYLGTDFTEDDCEVIYTVFGGGVNEEKAREFIASGYDMGMIERAEM